MSDSSRLVSKALFGSSHRLEIACAIADLDPGVFYARQLAESLQIPDNVVGRELARLEQAGVIAHLERVQQARYFERQPSCFWDFCRDMRLEVTDGDLRAATSQRESA